MTTRLYQYNLPVASRNWQTREGLILQWNDGWGEIAPLPGFSKETFEEAKAEILSLLPHLETAQPKLPSVRFGLSSAKRPLQSVHLPLCALGERDGFSTIKLKLGHLPLDEAIALVQRTHRHYRLRLDCNRSWTLAQALEFARHFKPNDFEYLEEPVRTFDELMEFSRITGLPIAVDESVRDAAAWQKLPSLKAVVVKPTVIGEIPQIPPGLELVLSSSYESGLGLLHIAALSKGTLPIGLDTYRALQDDILTEPIDCSSGFFSWQLTDSPINISKLCQIAP